MSNKPGTACPGRMMGNTELVAVAAGKAIYSTEVPQCGCHCKAGSSGEVNRCASHAAAYLQQDMNSGIKPLLFSLFWGKMSIANLQTV